MEQNNQKVIELWLSGKRKKTIRDLTGFTLTEIKNIILKYKQEQYLNQEGDDEEMGFLNLNKKPEPTVPTPAPQYRQDVTTDRLDIATGQSTKQHQVEEQGKIPLFARYDEATYMQLQLLEALLAETKNNTTELVRLRETIERVSK